MVPAVSGRTMSGRISLLLLNLSPPSVPVLVQAIFNTATSLNPERWAKDIEVQVSTDAADGPYRAISQITLKRSAEAQEGTPVPR